MPWFASATLITFGLGVTISAAAQAPQISKPRPAPPTPSAMPPLPPALIDPTLAVEGQELKARKVETRLTVKVRVNGSGPYDFVVDSGADTSVVGLRVARRLQLPLTRPALLNAMTSRSIVDRVRVNELTLGASTVRNLDLPALSEEHVGGEGMIGIDALTDQRLMLDFEKRRIQVEDARIRYKSPPGEIVVIGRRQRGQLILTHVQASGVALDAVIDTGAQVTVGNLALREQLVRRNRGRFETVSVTDVAGNTVDVQLAVIDELRLGPITLRNVPMAFADLPPFAVFGIADEPALLLGTDLLESFRRVSLDFRARKVRFQLRRCRPERVAVYTSPAAMMRVSSIATPDVCGR